ncbi:MAG TPA: hypothetical protein VFE25_05235 [Opitutaceae bacterium]|jgi:hypothetical protein|nr:hypothetical protein [Opitutaceae bacterium]
MIGLIIANFFTGALLCNSIPHLAAGLRGEAFPTPFAKPPGRGLSSPVVNVLWGLFNLLVAALLASYFPVVIKITWGGLAFALGFILIALHLAFHFGTVRRSSGRQ